MKKWLLLVLIQVWAASVFAQQTGEQIEMADAMRASGKIYVVVLVVCVILTGLIVYLVKLDRRVRQLEKEVAVKTQK